MSGYNDGGSAFPSSPTVGPNGDLMRPVDIGCQGMSLRDWFAGQALAGSLADSELDFGNLWVNDKGEGRIISSGSNPVNDGTNWRKIANHTQQLAKQCYCYADAMLAARGGTK